MKTLHKRNTSVSPLKGDTEGNLHHFQDSKGDTWVLILNVPSGLLAQYIQIHPSKCEECHAS